MIIPIITGLYAAILSLFIVYLASRVSKLRLKHRVGILDGGHPDLAQAIRVHGNAVEYVPLLLILLLCAELAHYRPLWLNIIGIVMLISRGLHCYGLASSPNASFGRMYGTLGTWVVIVILALMNLWAFIIRAL